MLGTRCGARGAGVDGWGLVSFYYIYFIYLFILINQRYVVVK
jgi:hypothetical protein